MNLSDVKSLNLSQVKELTNSDWTVERLATAQVKELTKVKGIGKVTAERVIEEAMALLNAQGLKEAEKLAVERYYQKTPAWKVILDWEEAGLSVGSVALSSIAALSVLKGIDEGLATRCISAAQTELNKRKLAESRLITPMPGGSATPKGVSSAFPVEWLSGQVTPPPFSKRIQNIFDQAKRDYEAANE